MKKFSILTAFLCLLCAASAIFAQDKTPANFAGTWQLDTAKSKLPERMRVESGTLVVAQTDKQLTVTTDFKRAARPENAPPQQPNDNQGMRPGGGMRGGGGMMGGGNGTATYTLDGKETKSETETREGMPPATLSVKAEIEKNGKLKLISSRSFETQMGAMTIRTVEVWETLDGGKTLKITRDTETPRGSQSAEMYFTRNAAGDAAVVETPSDNAAAGEAVFEARVNADGTPDLSTVKTISGGVLNGKAKSLPQPVYPPAAKAVKASGTVNVQITIDEQGKVIEASAVSGHPLLRAAAEKAARGAEFAPTKLSGNPVKVTGVLTFDFNL